MYLYHVFGFLSFLDYVIIISVILNGCKTTDDEWINKPGNNSFLWLWKMWSKIWAKRIQFNKLF